MIGKSEGRSPRPKEADPPPSEDYGDGNPKTGRPKTLRLFFLMETAGCAESGCNA